MNAPDLDSVAFSVRGGFAGLNLDVTSQDSPGPFMLHTGKWILFSEVQGRNPSVTTSRSPEPAVLPTVDAGRRLDQHRFLTFCRRVTCQPKLSPR